MSQQQNHKFIFFGSPEFSRIILARLIEAGFPPSLVVCNPDKPFGRKQALTPPPTKKYIRDNDIRIPVAQPESLEELEKLASDPEIPRAEFAVVAAYAKIIPKSIIGSFPKGVIGVHPSLLPKYRGASPIQSTILNGEKETGVTLYLLDDQMDHGPTIAKRHLDVSNAAWTYKNLEEMLANIGADALIATIPAFLEGDIIPAPQDHSKATFTKKIATEDGRVDLHKDDPETIARKIRALNPDPGAFTLINGKRVKLLEISKGGDGNYIITKIQPDGKNPQPAALKLPVD